MVGERGFFARLLAKITWGGRIFPLSYVVEKQIFFVEKPELPFLTSPLYLGGKIQSQAIPQHLISGALMRVIIFGGFPALLASEGCVSLSSWDSYD